MVRGYGFRPPPGGRCGGRAGAPPPGGQQTKGGPAITVKVLAGGFQAAVWGRWSRTRWSSLRMPIMAGIWVP